MNENKENIERIALSLFMKKGYASVGVQEICDESGITKPTLYHYFGSKVGILEHIVSTKGEELVGLLSASLQYRHDFVQTLRAALHGVVDFALSDRDYFALHCILQCAPEGSEEREVYRPYIERISSLLQSFFLESTREYGNMRGKEKLYSLLFSNLLQSTASLVILGEIGKDDATLDRIIHSFVYGVAS